MNWLAHLYLSKPQTEFRLGNILADCIKGQRWEGMSDDLLSGIRCHHEIDSFTDGHVVVKRSKSRLTGSTHLRGIAIDVFYDHLLTRNWDEFSDDNLREYLDSFYADATSASMDYPAEPRAFIDSLTKDDRLGRYAEIRGVEAALKRIDCRLSERVLSRGCLMDLLPSIVDKYEDLEADFIEFFPELVNHVR